MKKLGVWKTKTQRKHLEKLFVNDRNEEQDKSSNFFEFSKNLKQVRLEVLKPKNTFEIF